MKWLLAGCAAAALCGGTAVAGPCSQQIASLERTLSSRDAGSGPVQTQPGTGPTDQISEAGSSSRTTSEATRSPSEVRTGNAHVGPTVAMNQATAGSAASSQDVRLQQQGKPTTAEAARNGTPAAAAGQDKQQRVAADLGRARDLDRKNDSACAAAVDDARKDLAAD